MNRENCAALNTRSSIGLPRHISTRLIEPDKPWQKGTAESFNGTVRIECQSLEWFRSPEKPRVVIETWRRHCNHVRPHQSLEDLTPIELKTRYDSINWGVVLQF